MVEKLIRCTLCNQVIPNYGGFGDFSDASPLPGVEWSSEDLEEQRQFFVKHLEHPLEDLHADPETLVSDKPCDEPMKVSYFEASNGREKFLIRRTRSTLEHPAFYELIPGQILSNLPQFSAKKVGDIFCEEAML